MRAALLLPLTLLIAACDRAPTVNFQDASITPPDDPNELPDGPGRDVVLENCTACHSPSTMLQQPKVSREKWESIIGKMRKLYKAPVDDAAAAQVVDYMVAIQSDVSHEAPR
ncbi:MAG: cytochrome c [Porphyrobacter sp.]|nr:cytochrome c [Porphyrobacter sp.]